MAAGDADADGHAATTTATEPAAVRTLLADPRLVSILLLSGIGVFGAQAMPPALPAIQAGLGVSDARIGLVMTALFLPSFFMIPIVGAVSDIYGRRRVALVSLAGFGAAGVAIFFAPSFDVLLALRIVQGLCFGTLTPLSVAFIGDFFSGYAGTTAQGLRASTNGLVIIVAPATAGVLAEVAWNYPFLLYLSAFPALLFVHRYFPDTGFDDVARGSVREEVAGWLVAVGRSLRDPNLLLLILGGFVLFEIRITMFTYAPLFGTRTIGLPIAVVGVLFSLFGVVRILVAPQAGRVAARLSRKTTFVVTMAAVAGSMGLFAMARSTPTFVAAIVTFAAGMSLFNPTLNDAVTASASATNRAGVVGAMQSAKNVANTVGPVLGGLLLTTTDFRTLFLVVGGLAVAYVLLIVVRLEPVAG